jgi:hypothetical protein
VGAGPVSVAEFAGGVDSGASWARKTVAMSKRRAGSAIAKRFRVFDFAQLMIICTGISAPFCGRSINVQ